MVWSEQTDDDQYDLNDWNVPAPRDNIPCGDTINESTHHWVLNAFGLQVVTEKNDSIRLSKVANKQTKTQTD